MKQHYHITLLIARLSGSFYLDPTNDANIQLPKNIYHPVHFLPLLALLSYMDNNDAKSGRIYCYKHITHSTEKRSQQCWKEVFTKSMSKQMVNQQTNNWKEDLLCKPSKRQKPIIFPHNSQKDFLIASRSLKIQEEYYSHILFVFILPSAAKRRPLWIKPWTQTSPTHTS